MKSLGCIQAINDSLARESYRIGEITDEGMVRKSKWKKHARQSFSSFSGWHTRKNSWFVTPVCWRLCCMVIVVMSSICSSQLCSPDWLCIDISSPVDCCCLHWNRKFMATMRNYCNVGHFTELASDECVTTCQGEVLRTLAGGWLSISLS